MCARRRVYRVVSSALKDTYSDNHRGKHNATKCSHKKALRAHLLDLPSLTLPEETEPAFRGFKRLRYQNCQVNGRFHRQFRPRRKTGLARSAERGILGVS